MLQGCNFHEWDPGKVYRSAQPDKDELSKAHQQFNFKTIINLRGERPGKDWFDAFETAERPILIHCQAGADRTGETIAIYSMLYMGWSKEKASEYQDEIDEIEREKKAKEYSPL